MRTRLSRRTTIGYLDALAVALQPQGWRFVKFYRPEEFPTPLPMLWVHAGFSKEVGIVVSVRATPGGTWGYYETLRGRQGYLCPCGDAKSAAEQIDLFLKHQMFPSTW
ncbi:hypothetical protein HUT06_03950 [Actinomadura sp. NAK00032]|uniref:hypothetical protein n=1 Tax=Actinomadura sp. NAK00032 TaxID=2742128 RepID=UPI001590D320|nr:hypothetical protein [Actinomadura sp. NAK00032]QKW33286.1 hypothetical protein HUT06_03950 [Actinomadura sp. NAK00032]